MFCHESVATPPQKLGAITEEATPKPARRPQDSMAPKISIVTPSFNQGTWLNHAILSVATQNYPSLQHIVMDGGSSDGTEAVISAFAEKLHAVRSEQDEGQYDAINKGFLLSDGEIMCWLNSDDMHLPWTLSIVGEIFAALPEVRWLTTSFPLALDAKGNARACREIRSPSKHAILHGETLENSNGFVMGAIQQEGTFWRRDLWDQAGGRLETEFDYAADFDLWMRFAQYADIFSVNVPLAGFRQHGQQKTSWDMGRYRRQAMESFTRHGKGFSNRLLRTLARQCLPSKLRPLAIRLGWLYRARVVKKHRDTGNWVVSETLA